MAASRVDDFAGVFVGDEEDSGQDTPAGFHETLQQWCSTNRRKRAGVLDAATQRESQMTQKETRVETQVATVPSSMDTAAPVFVAGNGSGEDDDAGNGHYCPEEEEIDEDETQIMMLSMSQDQPAIRSTTPIIQEEEVTLPMIDPHLSTTAQSGGATVSTEDDNDADSDMSDDMLEQDGPAVVLSSIAASFNQKGASENSCRTKKRAFHVYKPRSALLVSPAVLIQENSASNDEETEVENEPDIDDERVGTAPAKSESLKLLKMSKSPSYIMNRPTPNVERSLRRSLTTPDHCSDKETVMRREVEQVWGSKPKRFCLDRDIPPTLKERHDVLPDEPSSKAVSNSISDSSTVHHHACSCDDTTPSRSTRSSRNTPYRATSRKSMRASVTNEFPDGTSNMAHDISADRNVEEDKKPHNSDRNPLASLLTSGHKRKLSAKSSTHSEQMQSGSDSAHVRIILTGLEPTASMRKMIKAIAGAAYEDDIEKATHVVVPLGQIKRTVKLLCGISCCAHILDERWLEESARFEAAVDERSYCLTDAVAEKKWQFSMAKTMYEFTSEQRRKLFAGHRFFITNHKSIRPPVKELLKIVDCAGGEAETNGHPGPNDIVITSDLAMGAASIRKQLIHANPQRIYSSELILRAILQQRIDFKNHRVAFQVDDTK